MKTLLFIHLMSFSAIHWICAQPSGMYFYYPDGRPYHKPCKTIAEINQDFDEHQRIKTLVPFCWDSVKYDCFVVVGYRLFTNQPLWIFTNSPGHLKESTAQFNYAEYLQGDEFEHDLEEYIGKQSLTAQFILETLGPPDVRTDSGGNEAEEVWQYRSLHLYLQLENSVVKSFYRD